MNCVIFGKPANSIASACRVAVYAVIIYTYPKCCVCVTQINHLNLMPLVANFFQYKIVEKADKQMKPWHMGAPLRVLSESSSMNTNMTGCGWVSNIFSSLCFRQK